MFQILKSLKSLKNYEFICRKQGHHRPNSEDEAVFLKDMQISKETYCEDCGYELELKIDEDDPEYYWTSEI